MEYTATAGLNVVYLRRKSLASEIRSDANVVTLITVISISSISLTIRVMFVGGT